MSLLGGRLLVVISLQSSTSFLVPSSIFFLKFFRLMMGISGLCRAVFFCFRVCHTCWLAGRATAHAHQLKSTGGLLSPWRRVSGDEARRRSIRYRAIRSESIDGTNAAPIREERRGSSGGLPDFPENVVILIAKLSCQRARNLRSMKEVVGVKGKCR